MAYIGSTPTSQNFISGTDYFSGTGSQTAFTLTRTVNSVNDIEVVINNVVQQPSTAYTLSGTTITFTSAPSSGTNNIYVRYLATTMQSITVPANSITRNSLDSNLQAGFQGRNKIINGDFRIDQRNAGASVSVTSSWAYCVDRFTSRATTGSGHTVQQSSTVPAGFTKSLKFTVGTGASVGSTDVNGIQQIIEGYNVADLGWGTANAKTITLSAWVYSSLTGTFGGSLKNDNADRSYPFTYTISSANTWTQISVTIAGDTSGTWATTNAGGLYVTFGLGVGSTYTAASGSWAAGNYLSANSSVNVVATSGATFYITGVQLEEGTTATSFERESYSVTLQKCQRYYQKTYDVGTVAGTTFNWEYNSPCLAVGTGNYGLPCGRPFLVPMRTSPTLTTYDGDGNSGKIAVWSVGTNQSYASVNVSQNQILAFNFGNNTTLGRSYLFAYTASAEL